MAALQPRSFSQIVQMIAAGTQGRAQTILDYAIGSTLRAVAEGHAGVALWLQGLILKLLLTTRAATSTGADLDTWVDDFGLIRFGATQSTGSCNFVRFTASSTTPFIAVGTTVQTADGTQTFTVIADTGNPLYSAAQNGYTLPAYIASITVKMQSLNAGYATNALAGTVTQLTTPIPGIDQVVNPVAFTGGVDAESDAELRKRFVQFIASLSKATAAAISYAVNSLHYGVQSTVTENFSYNGTATAGYFYVVVDDGSGSPSNALLTAAGAAVEIVRPLCIQYGIFPPVILPASIAMTVTSTPGLDHNAVIGNVATAVSTYVNTLPLGQSLSYTKLMAVAFNADPGVTDVLNYTLNGGRGDLVATPKNVIKISSLTVV